MPRRVTSIIFDLALAGETDEKRLVAKVLAEFRLKGGHASASGREPIAISAPGRRQEAGDDQLELGRLHNWHSFTSSMHVNALTKSKPSEVRRKCCDTACYQLA